MAPKPSQIVLPTEDQVFKPKSLGETFLLQTTRVEETENYAKFT